MAGDAATVPTPDAIAASPEPVATTGAPEISGSLPTEYEPNSMIVPQGMPSPAIASTPAAMPHVPMEWQAKKPSNWLAAILDTFRDAVAGHPTQVYTDAAGNKYVGAANESSAQKWMRVAGLAVQGAAAGYAGGQGPAGQGRAGLAGVNVGLRQGESQHQATKDQQAEVRQDTLDKFNDTKQKLEIARLGLENTRLGTLMNQDAITFSQQQNDREKNVNNAIDLGVHPNASAIADVQKQDPDAWKHFYEGRIQTWPEIGPDGKTKGLHVWLRPAEIASAPVPEGSEISTFVPPDKPGEKGRIVISHTSGPIKRSDYDAHNMKAFSDYNDWEQQRQKPELIKKQMDEIDSKIKEQAANTRKANNEASEAAERTRKLHIENDSAGVMDDNSSAEQLAEMMLDGRAAPSLIKNRKNYQTALALADQKSMQRTGQGFDAGLSEAMYEAYKNGVKDYLSGATAKSIKSFDKFLGHVLSASEAVNSLRNTDIKLVNTPLNKLSEEAGGKNSNAIKAFQQELQVARDEWQAFTANNKTLTDQDHKVGELLASQDAKPSDLQAAFKAWANTAVVRMRSEDYGYLRLTRNRSHLPMPLSDQGAKALQHFGIDPASVYASAASPEQMVGAGANVLPSGNAPATTPTVTNQPPAGTPANYVHVVLSKPDKNGKTEGWLPPDKVKIAQEQDPKLKVVP